MHQDYPFYPHEHPHEGANFIDCLVHLDDAPAESGCLHVVPKSHLGGPLEHITGSHTAPHLPPDDYHPDKTETVEIPATAGDVILLSYLTICWSDCSRTSKGRQGVRIGFHDAGMWAVGKYPPRLTATPS
jgi:ectoine hydroxylase-related dioxygenase (phytanoyl-CoA dioxygenase family)